MNPVPVAVPGATWLSDAGERNPPFGTIHPGGTEASRHRGQVLSGPLASESAPVGVGAG